MAKAKLAKVVKERLDADNGALTEGIAARLLTEAVGGNAGALRELKSLIAEKDTAALPEPPPETDVLARIAYYAGLQFTRTEIETLCSLRKWTGEMTTAYARGQLAAEETCRRAMLGQAGSGDLKALTEFRALIKLRQRRERDR